MSLDRIEESGESGGHIDRPTDGQTWCPLCEEPDSFEPGMAIVICKKHRAQMKAVKTFLKQLSS